MDHVSGRTIAARAYVSQFHFAGEAQNKVTLIALITLIYIEVTLITLVITLIITLMIAGRYAQWR